MDIPYRVNSGPNEPNSTTSTLFYGFKTDPEKEPFQCSKAPGSTNLYAGSEGIYRSTPPISATSNAWLVTMITHSNLALAKQIVDSGVLAHGTFPVQTVYLSKGGDVNRNVRYWTFDNAVFNTRLRGNYSMQRTSAFNGVSSTALGMKQGYCCITVSGTTYLPGAIA